MIPTKMDFVAILKVLQRKIWVLIIIPALTIVCSVFFISRMDKKYKSTAEIATGFTTDESVKLSEGSNANPFEINTNFINVIESMNSKTVLSLVAYRLVVHDLESEAPFRNFKRSDDTPEDVAITKQTMAWAKDKFKERHSKFRILDSYDKEDRILFEILRGFDYDHEKLVKGLGIGRVSSSDFISVNYVSENPFLSSLLVNAVCEEFIRYNKALKQDRSSESIEFLEKLVKEKKRVLDEKTATLNTFKVSNNVFNYDAESESKITLIADYEINRENERKKIKSLELSLGSVENKINSLSGLNQDEVVQVNQRIIELRRQIRELNNATDDASKTRTKKLRDELQLEMSRIDALKNNTFSEDLKELEKDRDQLKLELKIAESDLASIEQTLRTLKYHASGFAGKEAKLADLERDVEFASADYASVQDKYNTAKNKSLVIGSSIRQTLQGQPSYEPEPSKALLLMALAGAGSLALCIIVIFSIEFIDFSVRFTSRLERFTGLKNIGSINFVNRKTFNIRKAFIDKSGEKESQVFVHFLRKLRYEIQSSKNKVFLVTSTQENVGKSFLILSLSYTLSLIDKKVLIIDTNFRHNSLTKMLVAQVDNRKLLQKGSETEVRQTESNGKEAQAAQSDSENGKSTNHNGNGEVNGKERAETERHSIIHNTEFNGVDIIGNIGGYDSPSEIFAGKDFKEVVDRLATQYDCILLEGPSLNEYSDTKELIEYADKVIPVFGADTVLNPLDRESVQYLKSIKHKLLGTVLNKVQFKDLSI
ncbi:MAG: Wzz/FepE/Etk N-terminal domain-containing protein [Cyclobacteriaceae bacterium]